MQAGSIATDLLFVYTMSQIQIYALQKSVFGERTS